MKLRIITQRWINAAVEFSLVTYITAKISCQFSVNFPHLHISVNKTGTKISDKLIIRKSTQRKKPRQKDVFCFVYFSFHI